MNFDCWPSLKPYNFPPLNPMDFMWYHHHLNVYLQLATPFLKKWIILKALALSLEEKKDGKVVGMNNNAIERL